MSRLESIRVVLYEPQNYINIAATIRAMKNMGLSRLRLVRPAEYDPYRLEGIAHGTQDVIDAIESFDDFDAAVADCVYIAGFTARRRATRWRIIEPRAAAAELLERGADGPVALVFGREDNGLPNEILDMAHVAVTIPTTEHASLNLAQAALIGFYELHLAAGDATRTLDPPRKAADAPTSEHLELFFRDAARALEAIEFFKTRNGELIMRTIRSLTYRASPDARELSLVRSFALEVVNYLRRTGRTQG
jgi:TrmH family RNA methyltransferase